MQGPGVVVTGMGAVTAIGIGCDDYWKGLMSSRSGVCRITQFDPTPQKSRIAAEVKDFDPDKYFDRQEKKRMGRYTQFAMAAADEAIQDSGLDLKSMQTHRVAVIIASAIGDFAMIESQAKDFFENGPGHMSPFTVPRSSSNMASASVTLKYGILGPSFGISSACASGNHALAVSYLLIKSGLADVCVAGGSESAITPTFFESYIALRALSTRNDEPERASRPFDLERDGFVIGEGAGILVLESEEHAVGRGAKILAELAGIGMSSDASHITAPHPEGLGAVLSMKQSLEDAGIAPDKIDYINAHGTSTKYNDVVETRAIKQVFGKRAYRIPVSSTKSMIGHCVGAAGAMEAVACVLAINYGILPPTINLDYPDPECDLDYIPNKPLSKKVDTVMSNSFAFGGQNCTMILKRF